MNRIKAAVILTISLGCFGCYGTRTDENPTRAISIVSVDSKIKNIEEKDFEKTILNFKGLIVVDVWAEWCQPCQKFSPILEALAEKNSKDIKFYKLNYDNSQEIVAKYDIKLIPTLLFFNNGNLKEKSTGLKTFNEVQKIIDKYK